MTTRNRVYLLLAYAVCLASTMTDRSLPTNYATYLILTQAAGTTFMCALPSLIGRFIFRQRGISQAPTLTLAVLVGFGNWYARSH